MQDQLIFTDYQRKVTYMYRSAGQAYKLSERYVHDLAMPGRALKLLESAASYAETGFVTGNSVAANNRTNDGYKSWCGKRRDERENCSILRSHIHGRMLKTRAVQVVGDALRHLLQGRRAQ